MKFITSQQVMKRNHISEFLFRKIIPIKQGLHTEVDLNPAANDTRADIKYKVLLNIEYTFCLKIMNTIIQKASKLYEKQMTTGKVVKVCCDFKLLEEKCREYKSK